MTDRNFFEAYKEKMDLIESKNLHYELEVPLLMIATLFAGYPNRKLDDQLFDEILNDPQWVTTSEGMKNRKVIL